MAKKTNESRWLKTKAEVLAALGGVSGVSTLTGSPPKATENWRRAKTFPARYFLVMIFALWKKGLQAPPELWGMVSPRQRREALVAAIAQQREQQAA